MIATALGVLSGFLLGLALTTVVSLIATGVADAIRRGDL